MERPIPSEGDWQVMKNRKDTPSRQNGGDGAPARPDSSGKPENIEIEIDTPVITSRSRWPVPWAFAVLLALPIVASGAMTPYLPWFVGAGIFVLAMWLGLFELHLGRPPRA